MNTTIRKFTYFLTACLLGCLTGHAYEQDNWYLAWEESINSCLGVAYYENSSTGIGEIYICNGSGSNSKISVYSVSGTLLRNITVASGRSTLYDVALDENGSIYIAGIHSVTCLSSNGTFRWRKGKGATVSAYGSVGSGELEFSYPKGIVVGPDGYIYVADSGNHRIQVIDVNGTFIRSIGGQGDAPGYFNNPNSVGFIPDGTLVVRDDFRLHWLSSEGTFIKRFKEDSGLKRSYMATSLSGEIITWCEQHPSTSTSGVYDVFLMGSYGDLVARLTNDSWTTKRQDMRYAFTSQGDLITSYNHVVEYKKRAYRTKGLPLRNVIPQAAIHKVSQRSGTNVLDLDFEIIDSDDNNATVGIIAYCGNDKVVPQTWVDGTANKIGTPITTNQVHRVSWDVKQDWNTSTGTIKFEILCQDGRTNKPVDVHFLTLPLADGNLTISRSPLKDSDFISYAKYLLAKGDAQFASTSSTAVTYAGSQILTSAWGVTAAGRSALLTALGSGYRWATTAEVTKAREAATPGAVNNWTASVQVQPRNLPGKVNEYGFDVETTSGYWVVKE